MTDSFLQEDFQNLVLYTHILLHFPKLKQIFTADGKNLRLDTEAMYPRICEFARKVKKEEHIQLNKSRSAIYWRFICLCVAMNPCIQCTNTTRTYTI